MKPILYFYSISKKSMAEWRNGCKVNYEISLHSKSRKNMLELRSDQALGLLRVNSGFTPIKLRVCSD